jgi:hypothetical protein
MPKTVPVNVQEDHLQSIANVKRPIDAVAELVWNALDSDATAVRVTIARNNMTGLESIRVIDNGHGMDYRLAEETFGHLGGSWKKTKLRTDAGRVLHGKEGRGRFKAFALGTLVIWSTRFRDDAAIISYTLKGDWNHLREFQLSDFVTSKATTTGTDVEIRNILKDFTSLEGDNPIQAMTEQFALYLRQYPEVRIIYNGTRIDPKTLQDREADYALPKIKDVDRTYTSELTVIEWKNDQDRAILLCDASGFTLHEVKPQIHAAGFHFTAYLKSDYIRALADKNLLISEDVHPGLHRLLEAAREKLRAIFVRGRRRSRPHWSRNGRRRASIRTSTRRRPASKRSGGRSSISSPRRFIGISPASMKRNARESASRLRCSARPSKRAPTPCAASSTSSLGFRRSARQISPTFSNACRSRQ